MKRYSWNFNIISDVQYNRTCVILHAYHTYNFLENICMYISSYSVRFSAFFDTWHWSYKLYKGENRERIWCTKAKGNMYIRCSIDMHYRTIWLCGHKWPHACTPADIVSQWFLKSLGEWLSRGGPPLFLTSISLFLVAGLILTVLIQPCDIPFTFCSSYRVFFFSRVRKCEK